MADIAVRLGALELENFEHKSFIPLSELKKLFTRDKVYELLRQYDLHFHLINETVDRVLDGGLRTFALLGAVQDIGSITRFIKEDQFSGFSLDARLPLQGTDISRYFSNPEKGKLFLRRQWSFLAQSEGILYDFGQKGRWPGNFFLSRSRVLVPSMRYVVNGRLI